MDDSSTTQITGPQLDEAIQSSIKELTVTFKATIEFVDGVTPETNIIVQSGLGETSSITHKTASATIISSDASSTSKELKLSSKKIL